MNVCNGLTRRTNANISYAHKKPDSKKRKRLYIVQWVKAGLLLLLASWFYQPVLFMYMQFVLAGLLVASTKNMRSAIKNAFVCVLVVVVVGVISIAVSKYVFIAFMNAGAFDPQVQMRGSISSVQDIKDSISFVASNFSSIMVDGISNEPKYLMPICFLVVGACSVIALAGSFNKKAYFAVGILCLLVIFLLAFAPQFISKEHNIAPRTLLGVYVALAALSAVCLCLKSIKSPACILTTIVIAVALVANIYICNVGTKAELTFNNQERIYSNMVQSEIDKYEQQSGNKVNKIVRTQDADPSRNLEAFDCGPFDYRVWNIAVSWTTTYMINIYENKDYKNEEMQAADKERLFGNVNYDTFDPSKQMVFEGDTLYLLVY